MKHSQLDPIFFTPAPKPWDRRLWKDSPSFPSPPDPYATAAAQTTQNKDTAYFNAALNRPTEVTPYGTRSWSQVGGGPQYNMDAYNQAMQGYQTSLSNLQAQKNAYQSQYGDTNQFNFTTPDAPTLEQFKIGDSPGQWTSNITLSPQSQKIFDTQLSNQQQLSQLGSDQLGRIKDSVAKPYDLSSVAAMPVADDAARQRIEQALMERMQPYIDRDRAALENRMVNQGFADPGANAYRANMDTFNKGVNDARLATIMNAGNEQARLFNLGMQSHQQGISDYERQRYAPLNEYNSFNSGSQIGMPSFGANQALASSPANIGQYMNDAYQGQVASTNGQIGANNANTAAAGQLASSALMAYMLSSMAGAGAAGTAATAAAAASDIRVKRDIRRIGTHRGVGVYRFKYLWDDTEHVGVMAQEVQQVMPEAVFEHPCGFLMVDYAKVL